MLNISAIDVGSNAMRMVIGEVDESWRVNPIENIRLPVRLGEDVFSKGHLEEKTIQQTEEAFLRFKHMAESFHIRHLRAVATSAAREAANSDLLLDRVYRTSGIEIEIISGEEEARLIHAAVAHVLDLNSKRTLLIDIGGGSIELVDLTAQLREDTPIIQLPPPFANTPGFALEELSRYGVTVRALLRTAPGAQWDVEREFRRRIKNRLDTERIPFSTISTPAEPAVELPEQPPASDSSPFPDG